MKINNKLNEVKVGKIYFWDVLNSMSSIHTGTKTVRVLSFIPRMNANPLVTVQSMETKEIFKTDVSHLQLNPEYLKRKYVTLVRYYKRNKPDMLFKYTYFPDGIQRYVIVGNEPEVNCLRLLDKDGVLHSFGYDWFEHLNLTRNKHYDCEQEEPYGYYEEEMD